jgi:hypothetical protein
VNPDTEENMATLERVGNCATAAAAAMNKSSFPGVTLSYYFTRKEKTFLTFLNRKGARAHNFSVTHVQSEIMHNATHVTCVAMHL